MALGLAHPEDLSGDAVAVTPVSEGAEATVSTNKMEPRLLRPSNRSCDTEPPHRPTAL